MQNAMTMQYAIWPDRLYSHKVIFIVKSYSLDVDADKNAQTKH